ncbi:MAG: hypothetical protein AAFX05_04265 [Planctomycetota bacterium]
MDQLRRVLETIRTQLGGLTSSQKLLIGSLMVILVMTLFVVQQYTGRPSMVPLLTAGYGPEEQREAAQFLQGSGMSHQVREDGVVMVPTGTRSHVLAQMSQTPGALPSDTSLLFKDLAAQQSWTKSDRQNQQLEDIALQNEVSAVLRNWRGIRDATVLIDVPDTSVLGRPRRAPTAAVSVESEGSLNQDTVDAIAAFVAGTRAGLEPARVRITDSTTGRQHRPRSENDFSATDTLETIAAVEERHRAKIEDMLRYAVGCIVTVQAMVDTTQTQRRTTSALPEGKGTVSVVASESSTDRRESAPQFGGEPGARPNTGADIETGASVGSSFSENVTDTTFANRFGETVENVIEPGGYPTKINAVISIPRSYFAEIWKSREARKADGVDPEADPTDAQLASIVESETTRIRADVEKVIDTRDGRQNALIGEVSVSMIPVMAHLPVGSGEGSAAGLLGLGGSSGSMVMGDLVKTIALGGLAVLALGLVVMTAIKSNKNEPMPTAQELVGVPPSLEHDEIVGEAEAAEPALAGIELTDDEMKRRKVLEQVAEMIQEHPEDAAKLVGRWVTSPE